MTSVYADNFPADGLLCYIHDFSHEKNHNTQLGAAFLITVKALPNLLI